MINDINFRYMRDQPDCGTAVARINKVNTNAHDASGIFRDVYIQILGKVCRLRDCGSRIWWMIFQWPGILKFSPRTSLCCFEVGLVYRELLSICQNDWCWRERILWRLNPLWMYHLITFAQSSACPFFYYISTEIYSQNDSNENIVLCLVSANAISDANGELSLVKKHRSRRLIEWTILFHIENWSYGRSYGKPPHFWREKWQATFSFSRCRKGLGTSVRSVDRFIGAVIQGGFFSINVNRVHQSSKLTIEESLLA